MHFHGKISIFTRYRMLESRRRPASIACNFEMAGKQRDKHVLVRIWSRVLPSQIIPMTITADTTPAGTTRVRRGSYRHDSCTTGLLPTRLVYDGAPANKTRVRRGSCRHDSCTTGLLPIRLVYDGAPADTTRVRRGSCQQDWLMTIKIRNAPDFTEAPKSRRITPLTPPDRQNICSVILK